MSVLNQLKKKSPTLGEREKQDENSALSSWSRIREGERTHFRKAEFNPGVVATRHILRGGFKTQIDSISIP